MACSPDGVEAASATAANSSDPAGPPYVTELHSPPGIVPGEIVQVIPSGLVITLSSLTATKSSYPTGPPQVTDCQLPKVDSFIRSFILTYCCFSEHAKHLHHRFAGIGHAGSRG